MKYIASFRYPLARFIKYLRSLVSAKAIRGKKVRDKTETFIDIFFILIYLNNFSFTTPDFINVFCTISTVTLALISIASPIIIYINHSLAFFNAV